MYLGCENNYVVLVLKQPPPYFPTTTWEQATGSSTLHTRIYAFQVNIIYSLCVCACVCVCASAHRLEILTCLLRHAPMWSQRFTRTSAATRPFADQVHSFCLPTLSLNTPSESPITSLSPVHWILSQFVSSKLCSSFCAQLHHVWLV